MSITILMFIILLSFDFVNKEFRNCST